MLLLLASAATKAGRFSTSSAFECLRKLTVMNLTRSLRWSSSLCEDENAAQLIRSTVGIKTLNTLLQTRQTTPFIYFLFKLSETERAFFANILFFIAKFASKRAKNRHWNRPLCSQSTLESSKRFSPIPLQAGVNILTLKEREEVMLPVGLALEKNHWKKKTFQFFVTSKRH
ncbi:hypothetical protein CDAR_74691 [Caerostris darwini]|uniref:Secreted protein n=1 Tax=Caerostris darwini TaxID=1538125 RepID=A0AAV4P3J2_9ARAC|nr:hypothetical protein CDAR_74691 [Caerostris darwini]